MFEAKSIMTKIVVKVHPDTPAIEAVRLLVKNSISGMPVVDENNNLLGIVSEKDLLKFVNDPDNTALTVSQLMTREVVSFEETDSIVAICNCLIENNFRRVPITSAGKLVGIVSRRNVLKRILEMKNINITEPQLSGEDA